MTKKIRDCTLDELNHIYSNDGFIIHSHRSKGIRDLNLTVEDGTFGNVAEIDLDLEVTFDMEDG